MSYRIAVRELKEWKDLGISCGNRYTALLILKEYKRICTTFIHDWFIYTPGNAPGGFEVRQISGLEDLQLVEIGYDEDSEMRKREFHNNHFVDGWVK